MSASSSSQGFTSSSQAQASSFDASQEPTKASTKHRLSEEVEVQGQSKRQRTDHEREQDVNMADAPPANTPFFYKLGSTVVPRSSPHVSDDLMSMYGLDAMQQSVRRAVPGFPDSGVKLRKSYDGKVKDLEGKVKNTTRPGMLFSLLQYPDEEWQVQKVMGKELISWDHEGNEIPGRDPAEALLAKLGHATMSGPGRLPVDERAKWQSLLGSDDFNGKSARVEKGPAAAVKSQPHYSNSAPGSPRGTHTGPRPKRQGTKRRYHDDAFEGYGEGFVDDHLDNVSISGADDDTRSVGGSAIKKRRKVGTKPREVMNMESSGPGSLEESSMPSSGLDADYLLWKATNGADPLLPRTGIRGGRYGPGGRLCRNDKSRGKK